MSKANAAFSLPPGDRDDAPEIPPIASSAEAAAGRKPLEPDTSALDQTCRQIATALDEAQLALGKLRRAQGEADWPVTVKSAWDLCHATMIDLSVLAATARREAQRCHRFAIAAEIRHRAAIDEEV